MRRMAAWLAAAMMITTMICGCRKTAPAYKEKTRQERAESYHRNLSTPDLQLFHLRGAVKEAEVEVKELGHDGMLLYFLPNGLLESAVFGGDSISIVRNSSGEILRLETGDGSDLMPLVSHGDVQSHNVAYY